jgi:hypothetical protein
MKQYVFMLALITTSLIALVCEAKEDFTLYKETALFKLFCTPVDHPIADAILEHCEKNVDRLAEDFKHTYSNIISLYMYQNIQDFHEAISRPNAPDWIACSCSKEQRHSALFVSPNNAGSYHSAKNILWLVSAALGELFIADKFQHPLPRWLHAGIARYKAGTRYTESLGKLVLTQATLPTLSQLEPNGDDIAFGDDYHGYQCSYSLVEFLCTTWGWDKTLELLDHYENFESILGVSKAAFEAQWKVFLVQHYGPK